MENYWCCPKCGAELSEISLELERLRKQADKLTEVMLMISEEMFQDDEMKDLVIGLSGGK